jgi:hypothetical protein
VFFDGSSWMQASGVRGSDLSAIDRAAVFAVFRPQFRPPATAASGTFQSLLGWIDGFNTVTPECRLLVHSAWGSNFIVQTGALSQHTFPVDDDFYGKWHYLSFRRLSTGALLIRLDGITRTVSGPATLTTCTSTRFNNNLNNFMVGSDSGSTGSVSMRGDVAEVVTYGIDLSDAQMNLIEDYIRAKYNFAAVTAPWAAIGFTGLYPAAWYRPESVVLSGASPIGWRDEATTDGVLLSVYNRVGSPQYVTSGGPNGVAYVNFVHPSRFSLDQVLASRIYGHTNNAFLAVFRPRARVGAGQSLFGWTKNSALDPSLQCRFLYHVPWESTLVFQHGYQYSGMYLYRHEPVLRSLGHPLGSREWCDLARPPNQPHAAGRNHVIGLLLRCHPVQHREWTFHHRFGLRHVLQWRPLPSSSPSRRPRTPRNSRPPRTICTTSTLRRLATRQCPSPRRRPRRPRRCW